MPAYPDDLYIAKIGRAVYAAAALEWLLLGDLDRLKDQLPSALNLPALSGETMGGIATIIEANVDEVIDPAVQRWVRASGEALREVAGLRNHLLHARPATVDGQQRLHRWRSTGDVVEAFAVTDEWIDETIARIGALESKVCDVRLPFDEG